jgi:hypothetical protein
LIAATHGRHLRQLDLQDYHLCRPISGSFPDDRTIIARRALTHIRVCLLQMVQPTK